MTNRGNQPITVKRFTKDCDCLDITPGPGVVLAPSETKPFTITLALLARPERGQSGFISPFRVRLTTVYSVDEGLEGKSDWDIHCDVIPTLGIKTKVIPVGPLSVKRSNFEQTVEVEAGKDVASIECSAPVPWSVRASKADPRVSVNRFRVTVKFEGKPTPRPITDVIRLTPMTEDEKPLPSKEIRLEGEFVTDVVAHPRELQHGRQSEGAVLEETIRLHSLTNRAFSVTRAVSRTSDLQIARLEGQDAATYNLRLRVSELGNKELAAEFVVKDEDGDEYVAVVPVRYYGVAGP